MEDVLIKDVCARLPYKPIVDYEGEQYEILGYVAGKIAIAKPFSSIIKYIDVKDCRLYLRPMSSMTEEEIIDFLQIPDLSQVSKKFINDFKSGNFGIMANMSNYARNIDWLNKNMFDFRGLIPKDLALSTEEYNPYVED